MKIYLNTNKKIVLNAQLNKIKMLERIRDRHKQTVKVGYVIIFEWLGAASLQ